MMDKLPDQPTRKPVVLPPPHQLNQRLDATVIAELVQAYLNANALSLREN
jgi:hypothetical protein